MAGLRLTARAGNTRPARVRGFSLVELAMVLFIISLVIGGLLVPLATQMEARQRSETQAKLEEIREALIGFAMINGRLPFCTDEADPAAAGYGEEDPACDPTNALLTADNILPWKTLGLTNGLDPWGTPRTSATDPWTGHWRYRVNSTFSATLAMSATPATNNLLCVVDTSGNLAVDAGETPVALVYSTGANITADGENANYEPTSANTTCDTGTSPAPVLYESGTATTDFDDLLIWISRPLLISRLVTAGTLP